MSDLLSELQFYDPFNYPEKPYNAAGPQTGNGIRSDLDSLVDKLYIASGSSGPAAVQPAGNSFLSSSSNSSTPDLAGVAAAAAYRKQYLESVLQQQSGQQTQQYTYTLKSRPGGMHASDYGPKHAPGYLPQPTDPQEKLLVPHLPVKSGTGLVLVPARLKASSCCPPPYQEPLVAMAPDAKSVIAQRQAQRVVSFDALINRLVYDSLEPPLPSDMELDSDFWLAGDSNNASSCRRTRSGVSTRTTTANEDAAAAAATGNIISTETEAAVLQVNSCKQNSFKQKGSAAPAAAQAVAAAAAAAWAYAPGLDPWYVPQGPHDPTMVFESRFECGNLRRAIQVLPFEYDLVLQPDLNTRGHTQWYFFAVSNVRAGQPYRFNIINLQKEDSLYNMGMLPLIHSEQQMLQKGIGWVRAGSNVCYGANCIRYKKTNYYTLTFVVEFPYSGDLVHLAHCYPYSYTDLHNHLYMLCKDPNPSVLCQRSCMALSLAGNVVDVLTITAAADWGKPMHQRQGVVLSARVHPGETNASWMMKGALQQLMGDSAESAQLRETFVFKVVPMLNPDGVSVGNYRCSLAGQDLNRVWQDPDGRMQPVVRAFKEMIKAFETEREVVLFCDLHGHSRQYGVFIYGCEQQLGRDSTPQLPGWPVPGSIGGLPGVPVRHQERMFPLMLHINAPDLFSYKSCNFKVQKSKAGTGRVVGFRELGLVNAFTMEASFCGANTGKFAKLHFNTGHLEDMGAALVRTLLDYWAPQDTSSAAELSAHLDAQLLPGEGAAAGGVATPSALSLLLEAYAGDEKAEDYGICTDSDDSSSEDEQPVAAGPASQVAASNSSDKASSSNLMGDAEKVAGGGAAESAAAAAARAEAMSISRNVAHIGNRLVALLSSAPAAAATGPSSSTAAAANAASMGLLPDSTVAALVTALKGLDAAPPAIATGPSSGPAAANNSSSSSSTNVAAVANTAALAAVAAHALLDKLQAAKSMQQGINALSPLSSSQPTTGPDIAAGASTSASRANTAGGIVIGTPEASTLKRVTADSQPTPEAAVLASTPGLVELLQQLVTEQAALEAAVAAAAGANTAGKVAKGTKKRGKKKVASRYGNPAVLRAARAAADASLAATLPVLGLMLEDGDGSDDDAADIASSFTIPAAATESSSATLDSTRPAAGVIMAGRRANVASADPAGRRSSMLDAARYIDLLERQKQHTMGILASSSIDYSTGSDMKSPYGGSRGWGPAAMPNNGDAAGSTGRSSNYWATGRQQQQHSGDAGYLASLASPTAAAAAAAAAATGAAYDAGHAAGVSEQQPMTRRRRSKSAHAWLQDSFKRRTAADADNPIVYSQSQGPDGTGNPPDTGRGRY